jgi:hypothetical protein
VVVEGGIMLVDTREHPDWDRELARSAGEGTLGGTVGATTEQMLAARYALSGTGGSSARALLGTRAPLGGAGAGAGAMAIETLRMAFEDRPHSTTEVTLREGRAFVVGGISGYVGTAAGSAAGTIAASALLGTELGTVVPGLGNAIGFVVGLGVGITTAYILDRAIPQVPADVGR